KFDRGQLILGNPPLQWLDTKPIDLEFWQLDSAGFDKYKGVKIKGRAANMGDWFARPCAETIVAGLLALYRGIDALTLLKQNKQWVGHAMRPYLGLMDRREVVVLGGGTIGTATRQILEGFRCRVRTVARTAPNAEIRNKEELLTVLPLVDIVVNTLPGTVEKYVDREMLATMKSGSVYANVGRGNTTDEDALLDALRNDHLSGAVLDVTETEPLPADNPLWTLPNVILTQHTGGGQADEDVGKVELFLRNLANLEAGEALESEVDLGRGY
ncbi:NAD(P)-dependent oxidoreductase, partial [Persicitalea sp.]|uniref:NAD(P)-dependent oxidoreductase n=1 Tax=Persicitalea sp. TaxID=3100273 RepID=UPI0035938E59